MSRKQKSILELMVSQGQMYKTVTVNKYQKVRSEQKNVSEVHSI
jgi:ribosomal protein S17